MNISKRTEEEYWKIFGEKHYKICEGLKCQCHKEVIAFIHQSQVDAIKEFVEGLLPEKWTPQRLSSGDPRCEGWNACIDKIQERINERLKL